MAFQDIPDGPISVAEGPIYTQAEITHSNSHQDLIGGFLIAAVISIFIALAYRRWRGNAKRMLSDVTTENDTEISMNNKSAMIFAGAIAFAALAYFSTHIYIPCGINNSRICNSVTGSSVDARE